jgi:hypothetical protein
MIYLKFTTINYSSNNNKIEEKKIVEKKITNITDMQSEITKIVKELSPGVVSIIIKKDLLVYRNSPF